MINGTPMQRMRDKARARVAPARIAAFGARSVEAAVETVATVEERVSAQAETLVTVTEELAVARNDLDGLMP